MNTIEFNDATIVDTNLEYSFASNTVTITGDIFSDAADSQNPGDNVVKASASSGGTSGVTAYFDKPVREAAFEVDTGPEGAIVIGYDAQGNIAFAEQLNPINGQALISFSSVQTGLQKLEVFANGREVMANVDNDNIVDGALEYLGLQEALSGIGGLLGGGGGDPFVELDLSLILKTPAADAAADANVSVAQTGKPASAFFGIDKIEFDESFTTSVLGQSVDDTINGSEGEDFLAGGEGNDTLSADAGDDVLDGGEGDDVLDGGEGDDLLMGGDGDDVLVGGEGSDTLKGGAGFDTASYATSQGWVQVDIAINALNGGAAAGDVYDGIEGVLGSAFADNLRGDDTANQISSGAGNDVLYGRAGDDILQGDDGNDVLFGGAGADSLIGGVGNDMASYADSASGLIGDLMTTANNTGIASGDTYESIEILRGSQFDDGLRGDNTANRLQGLDGNDTLVGRAGADRLSGGDGDDILNGGIGNDQLVGGQGIDLASYEDATGNIRADLFDTSVHRGSHAVGDSYNSIEGLIGSSFTDILGGDNGANIISGMDGRDYIRGRAGDDTLNGNDHNDVLFGGRGADTLNGGEGSDWAGYRFAGDGVIADLANETVNTNYAAGDVYNDIENIRGSFFEDSLRGDAGNNFLFGDAGDDTLMGRDGEDILRGGTGDDTLNGGTGADFLAGSTGNDTFVFDTLDGQADTVRDFQIGNDIVHLDASAMIALEIGALSANVLVNGATALDGDDYLLFNEGTLYYDADANGAGEAVALATFVNGITLDADDIFIV